MGMIFIEFVGNPGAGKSTLVTEVISELQLHKRNYFLSSDDALFDIALYEIDETYRHILRSLPKFIAKKIFKRIGSRSFWQSKAQSIFFAQNLNLFVAVLLAEELSNLSVNDRAIVLSSLQECGGVYECILRSGRAEKCVFFDEGIIQKSMMFVSPYMDINGTILEKYLSSIHLPHIVINLEIDEKLSYQRMSGRLKGLTGRLRCCSRKDIETFLFNSTKHWNFVTEWLISQTPTKVLTVSSALSISDTVNDIVTDIVPVIENLLGDGLD